MTNFKGVPGPGRPKGSPNKLSRQVQEKVEWVLEQMEEYLQEDLAKMKPSERIRLWYDLQEFIRPKQQRVMLDAGNEDRVITKITFELVDSSGNIIEE